jgi:hypothetical protein
MAWRCSGSSNLEASFLSLYPLRFPSRTASLADFCSSPFFISSSKTFDKPV